ncbi:DUF4391 domain-containing protein [Methanobrevibacter sp.]|uniref:DUF4391 domain-containing protein n=1 Tax=Methanobrevibacter sp. TaxID=66852 RepID=UPI0038659CBF
MVLIEDILEVPNNCIVDAVIPKKEVFEAANLNSKDKRIFTDLIKQIKWCYNFTEDNVRVDKFIDEERRYEEVELININLKYDNVHKIDIGKFKEDDKIDRIADIVMRFIPYPIILTIQYENELKFYTAHIRESKADFDKIVIDGKILSTNWMNLDKLSDIEEDFITKIQFDNLDRTDFYSFYNSYFEAVVQHDGAMTAGGTVNLSVEEIKRIYEEISILDLKIKEIEKKISQEDNFNVKMELNIKAHSLKQEKEKLINELKR